MDRLKPDEEGLIAIPNDLQLAHYRHQAKVIVMITEGPREDSAARWGSKGNLHLRELYHYLINPSCPEPLHIRGK